MVERVFAMPDLGEGLDEGEIVAWLVGEGTEVTLNQPLVEIETAKATVEVPSPYAGVVQTLHGTVGETIAVGRPLATFDVEGAADAPVPGGDLGGAAPIERSGSEPAKATPPVRKLARSLGVDLAAVPGSGPDGRITTDDVQRAARATDAAGPADEARAPDAADAPEDDPNTERHPLTPTRRRIAENLSSQAAIPQVTTFRTVDSEALDASRREREVSPLPVLIAALCRAVEAHPLLNARWTHDAILVHRTVDVGVAVDTDRGLVVPVLRDAERRGIGDLATEIIRLATSARDGSLAVDDLAPGPTIAVSNTGSYGSEAGTPLLSPNTAVTLAIGVIEPRALVVDGLVVPRLACTLSCTFDHRVLDGATVGRAMTDLVGLLEDPDRLGDLPA